MHTRFITKNGIVFGFEDNRATFRYLNPSSERCGTYSVSSKEELEECILLWEMMEDRQEEFIKIKENWDDRTTYSRFFDSLDRSDISRPEIRNLLKEETRRENWIPQGDCWCCFPTKAKTSLRSPWMISKRIFELFYIWLVWTKIRPELRGRSRTAILRGP